MLQVCYEGQVVGDLSSQDRILSFSYRDTWLNTPDCFPLTPHLPLVKTTYQGDDVLFFFSNLLPEGTVLSTILKLKRLPQGDIYAQLALLGEEVAGAFSIAPIDTPKFFPEPSYQVYDSKSLEKDLQQLSYHTPLLMQHAALRLSLAGAQNKIPVKFEKGQFWLPVNGAPSTHILKPAIQPHVVFRDSVWNEALCLRLAKQCGLNAVSLEVFFCSEPVLVIERYDRIQKEKKIQRLHQLDFCQLTGRLPDQKYEKEGGISLKMIFDVIDRYTDKPALNRLKALDWILFNYLIGNADAHAKNLAVLVLPNNKIQLAPFYDILCTQLYDSLDTRMAMAIGGEYRPEWVRKKNWHQFAQDISINITLLRERALKLAAKMSQCLPLAANSLELQEDNCIVQKIAQVIQQHSRWLDAHLLVD